MQRSKEAKKNSRLKIRSSKDKLVEATLIVEENKSFVLFDAISPYDQEKIPISLVHELPYLFYIFKDYKQTNKNRRFLSISEIFTK